MKNRFIDGHRHIYRQGAKVKRTIYCGDLRKNHVGQSATLCGWIHSRRDHGGVLFCDLRDRSGLSQIVFHPEKADLFKKADVLGSEFVVQVTGKVLARPDASRNPNIATGDVEVGSRDLWKF